MSWRPLIGDLATVVAYAGLACVTTWPLVTKMSTHWTGNSTDALLHYWNGWWVQHALANGQNPLFTPYLFYPNGASLVTHNIAWLSVLPWLALAPWMGGILAYNLVVLLNLTLCGCCAYLLARSLDVERGSAFVAGLIYLAWPYRISQVDYVNLTSTYWVPIFFLFLIATLRKGRWRGGLASGVAFALVGYSRWQHLIPVTLTGLSFFAGAAADWVPRDRRRSLVVLVAGGAVAVALLAAPIWLLASHAGSEFGAGDLMYGGDEERMQADLLAYLTPGSRHPLWGERTRALYDRYYANREPNRRYPAYIGFVALFLATWGIRSRGWKALSWVLVGLVLVSLALGPTLRLNGRPWPGVPTLYRLLSPMVFVRWIRIPERFNMFLALPVSMLAAFGGSALLARTGQFSRWRPAALLILVCGAILLEYLAIPIPLFQRSAQVPLYQQMAEEEGAFAVLNVPFNESEAKEYMFAQTLHGRPIVQGSLSRTYEGLYSYVNGSGWLSVLRHRDEMPPYLTAVSRELRALNEDGIRYVILHKTWVGADRVAHWQQYLLTQPFYEDGQLIAYRTDPEAGRDFALMVEMVPGLGPIDAVASADCLTAGHVLEVDVGWGSRQVPTIDWQVAISLVDQDGVVRQRDLFPVSDALPTSQWSADEVVWGHYALSLSGSLPEATYRLVLDLVGGEEEGQAGQPWTVRQVEVRSSLCNLASEQDAQDVNALFGDVLRLVEYSAVQVDDRLDLTLYWHAERRMQADYKVFVHVADPATGIPAAQDDAMPRRNAYPTTFWWPGERVEDRVSISLQDVPEGRYDIAVGVYEPASGQRLPLRDREGQQVADGRLILAAQVTR